MSTATNTFEKVKAVILSAHKSSSLGEKVNFYNSWAENYDQDVAVLEYRAPSLAANSISSHFSGDREAAVMLDVACGTGLVAKQMKTHGFGHFVGVDGSEAMLEIARESGLYQDLKQALLGEDPLPVQWVDSFDVVVIIGALSEGQVQVCVVRELCKSTKPGGYVCMTTRANQENLEYKGALELELKQMEEDGLWSCVEVTNVQDWERAVSEKGDGYIPGAVYLYKKLPHVAQ
ncbi:putative Williams-Beuren syndrome chromosomal region 27 protein-like isoform 2 [Scophthalmus maximus]|nr:methyltransferase-like protein 27 [Scophthalmus maximus]XP_035480747.1 methyltransferase-like protein 27 [Scophthalmus maximus]XP_035480748.1 methyltransferase-like protein 27 [Scophthalmus maximus]XP_035480749.1 methyltransferase-like protein 27 [Scophthalmus maximus]AWO99852.1 putative Williams-Beuren syndrome chromosomal region 27 protein-like isoform 2 [Scophthalmus maximus]